MTKTIQFSGASDVKTTGENKITHTEKQKKQLLHIVYLTLVFTSDGVVVGVVIRSAE